MDNDIKFNIGLYGVPPCKGCNDRAVGCHGTCNKYQEWHTAREQATAEWHTQGEQDYIGYKKHALKSVANREFRRKKEGRK